MDSSLKQRWSVLEGRKNDLHERNEKYARWTLPYLYPDDSEKSSELYADQDSVGARVVNHLSNKLVETLFPSYRPFLKLELGEDLEKEFEAARVPSDIIDKSLVAGEKNSIKQLDNLGHRTTATLAAKYLITTGNALMYYPETKCQVYNTRDYCIMRDLAGQVIEFITRDMKAFETFSPEVQTQLKTMGKDKKYDEGTDVTLYTQVKLQKNKKYKVRQAADMVDLDINDNEYARKDLPWVPLAWNLVRGEDYGRGMVEDYRNAFNAITVLSTALLEGTIAAATLKFLVNPGSVIDVAEMNRSPNGSYHSGRDGDIVTVKSDKHLDFQAVRELKNDYERQIGQAFLLHSETTRDAERVTAAEIRAQAQELNMSYGGVYSRFTEDWQKPVANLLLARQNITINESTVYPVIVTGLDTLSRQGDLDNYRMFMEDLSILASIPENYQRFVREQDMLMWLGNNRGLDYTKFIKSQSEVQAEEQAMMAQQQQQMAAESANQLAVNAGTELAKQEL